MASSRDLAADLAMLMRYVANLRREADRADALLAASEAGIPVDTRPPAKPLRGLAAESRDVADGIAHVVGVVARPPGV